MTARNGCCGGHARMSEDLRGTALQLLERLRGAVEPLRTDGASGEPGPVPPGTPGDDAPPPGSAGACTACPVCALLAVLRGERSELAGRLVEHAATLLALLTAMLEEPEHAAPPPRGNGARPHGGRSVQRIVVHRS